MNHPAERRLPNDPVDPQPSNEPATDGAWLEARIPVVFAAVLATWVLIGVWNAFRYVMR